MVAARGRNKARAVHDTSGQDHRAALDVAAGELERPSVCVARVTLDGAGAPDDLEVPIAHHSQHAAVTWRIIHVRRRVRRHPAIAKERRDRQHHPEGDSARYTESPALAHASARNAKRSAIARSATGR